MKFFSQYFWGVLLICVGVAYLLKYNLNLNIPIFRTAVGLIIVFLGLSILFSGFGFQTGNDIIFDGGSIKVSEPREDYNLIFSNGVIDLRDIPLDKGVQRVNIHCIFSSGTVLVGADQPVVARVNAAFASASLPNGTSITFGDTTYRSGEIPAGTNHLEIKADAVFGNLKIVVK